MKYSIFNKRKNDNTAITLIISLAIISLISVYWSFASMLIGVVGMFWIFFIWEDIDNLIKQMDILGDDKE